MTWKLLNIFGLYVLQFVSTGSNNPVQYLKWALLLINWLGES